MLTHNICTMKRKYVCFYSYLEHWVVLNVASCGQNEYYNNKQLEK